MLSSVEMVAISRLWAIFHFSIVQPLCYLAANTHKFAAYDWGVVELHHVLDCLKDGLESIIDRPKMIHDKSFMMGLVQPWAGILPLFQHYMRLCFEVKKTRLVAESKINRRSNDDNSTRHSQTSFASILHSATVVVVPLVVLSASKNNAHCLAQAAHGRTGFARPYARTWCGIRVPSDLRIAPGTANPVQRCCRRATGVPLHHRQKGTSGW